MFSEFSRISEIWLVKWGMGKLRHPSLNALNSLMLANSTYKQNQNHWWGIVFQDPSIWRIPIRSICHLMAVGIPPLYADQLNTWRRSCFTPPNVSLPLRWSSLWCRCRPGIRIFLLRRLIWKPKSHNCHCSALLDLTLMANNLSPVQMRPNSSIAAPYVLGQDWSRLDRSCMSECSQWSHQICAQSSTVLAGV